MHIWYFYLWGYNYANKYLSYSLLVFTCAITLKQAAKIDVPNKNLLE